MKLLIFLLLPMFGTSQIKIDSIDWSKMEMICGVAHYDADGNGFSCNYKGTLYPFYIRDSTINKWFVKTEGKDSIFYYKHNIEWVYIWNGRPKSELYGYECKKNGTTIGNPYKGKDTLIIKDQAWMPK